MRRFYLSAYDSKQHLKSLSEATVITVAIIERPLKYFRVDIVMTLEDPVTLEETFLFEDEKFKALR